MPRKECIGRKRRRPAAAKPPQEDEEDEEEEELSTDVAGAVARIKPLLELIYEDLSWIVTDKVIDQMIDDEDMIESLVSMQMCRLQKREVTAYACRRAAEERMCKRPWNERELRVISLPWLRAWEEAIANLAAFQREHGFECQSCALVPALCDCEMDCSLCESRHKVHPWRPGGQCNPVGGYSCSFSLNHRTNGGHSDVEEPSEGDSE